MVDCEECKKRINRDEAFAYFAGSGFIASIIFDSFEAGIIGSILGLGILMIFRKKRNESK